MEGKNVWDAKGSKKTYDVNIIIEITKFNILILYYPQLSFTVEKQVYNGKIKKAS